MQIKSVLLLAIVALSCVLALVSAKGPNRHHTQRPKRSYHYYGDDDGFDMARMRYNYGDDVDSLPMARHRHGYGDDTDMAAQHYGYNRYGYGDDEEMKKQQAAEMDRQHKKA